ncbi:hypothetical protein [Caldalkalibacillus mannanilyticus]|uniref:hypothetical protein n=1 Tax=Caldalkalibacillus mannanilyticus TaxID=1418 RepID=UPI000AB772D0|nr:hypothetical protein [Caldalkalibacillus mannanilyticus]
MSKEEKAMLVLDPQQDTQGMNYSALIPNQAQLYQHKEKKENQLRCEYTLEKTHGNPRLYINLCEYPKS